MLCQLLCPRANSKSSCLLCLQSREEGPSQGSGAQNHSQSDFPHSSVLETAPAGSSHRHSPGSSKKKQLQAARSFSKQTAQTVQGKRHLGGGHRQDSPLLAHRSTSALGEERRARGGPAGLCSAPRTGLFKAAAPRAGARGFILGCPAFHPLPPPPSCPAVCIAGAQGCLQRGWKRRRQLHPSPAARGGGRRAGQRCGFCF